MTKPNQNTGVEAYLKASGTTQADLERSMQQMQKAIEALPEALGPWALSLSDGGQTLTYSFDAQQDDTGVAELLQALSAQGIHFKDLRSSESSLEDIFVSLVHQPATTPATPPGAAAHPTSPTKTSA